MNDVSRERVEESIRRLLVAELGVDAARLAGRSDEIPLLGRGVGLDSVEALALALSLEREFEISIPDRDLTAELFVSLRALADYVGRALAEQRPA